MHGRYVTDILKMCMKKFNAEKIIFDKFTRKKVTKTYDFQFFLEKTCSQLNDTLNCALLCL